MSAATKIRIAIIGGGIAGATTLHALLPHPHLDVHIFEAAASFRESGASIGIHANAMKAFELIGDSAAQCVERADPFLLTGLTIKMAVGKDQGRIVGEVGHQSRGFLRSVGRGALLRELLAGAPAERMHASKKLERVEQKEDGALEIYFEDGSTHCCDILIGADGVRSGCRRLVLGGDDAAASPYKGAWWSAFSVRPYEEAAPLLHINDTCQHIWIGDNAFAMYSIFAGGRMVVFGLASRDDLTTDGYNCSVPAAEIRKLYLGWPPHIINAIEKMILVDSEVNALCPWEHSVPASTYIAGPICLVGDAAHATTPWLGSGGGMSIEDVLILSTLLGKTKTVPEALTALQVYDEVRRPRTQRVVEASRKAGFMMTGRGEDTGLNPDLLAERLAPSWNFIHDLDVAGNRDEAVEELEHRLAM